MIMYSILMKIQVMSYFPVMKLVFLVSILIMLTLMILLMIKITLKLLFMSDFHLGILKNLKHLKKS